MVLKRFFLLTAVAASAAFAQSPAFEVASIRPAAPFSPELMMSGKMHVGMRVDGSRVDIGFTSLRELIPLAYGVKPYQVVGPDWMGAQRFDIVATLPEGAKTEQVPQMLQALLAERFKLVARRDNKEQPVYALTVAKGGPKLKEAAQEGPQAAENKPAVPSENPDKDVVINQGDTQLRVRRNEGPGGRGVMISGGKNGAQRVTMGPDGKMHMEIEHMTMPEFAAMLSPMLDKPVVDQTALPGAFQIELDVSMADMMSVARASGMMPMGGPPPGMAGPALSPGIGGGAPGNTGPATASDPAGGSVFASVQKLGLKLDSKKAAVETIVVEHLEKDPTEN